MSIKTLGNHIRILRKKMNLSQHDLGQLTGISQSRISKLERGRAHPHQREWTLLSMHLGLSEPELPERPILPFPSRLFRVARPEYTDSGEVDFEVRFFRARKVFGTLADTFLKALKARADFALTLRFLDRACLDSAYEAIFWMHALAAGGTPCWFAPLKAGFRSFRVVDRERRTVGDVRQPCVELSDDVGGLLLFPQVSIDARRAYYRLDALACVVRGRRRIWVNIEIDGGGHAGDFDEERECALGLHTVRLVKTDLEDVDLLAKLKAHLYDILDRGAA